MDYEGQRLAELIFYWIILSFGGVGWVIGYFRQDFTIVFQWWLVGVAISVVVSDRKTKELGEFGYSITVKNSFSHGVFHTFQLCVPDWPFYNRHPVKWLESVPDRREKK